MSDQALLQALQRELAIEKAARQELEKQTVLKTRQLWHLREQQGKELQQYQEQLSVLRTSLILAHKQQSQHEDPYSSAQQHSRAASQSPAAPHILQEASTRLGEDAPASPRKADQHRAARHFTPDSPQKLKSFPHQSHQQHSGDTHNQQQREGQHQHAGDLAGCALLPAVSTPPEEVTCANTAPKPGSSSTEQTAQRQQEPHQQQQHTVAADTAELLLAAASKVQQLVEQLSTKEPSAAADLSVLQWQLTAVYGSLTCSGSGDCSSSNASKADGQDNGTQCGTSSNEAYEETVGVCGDSSTAGRQQRGGVLQGVACDGSDPLSAACSPAAPSGSRRSTAALFVDAATGTSPPRDAAAAAADSAQFQPSQQQQGPDMQEACRIAAAAQLFSGAANSSSSIGGSKLVAASLAWYYLEPGDPPIVKGPYDAGLMLRWFLKGFLDNALRIAGVVQSSSSSSGAQAPPQHLEDFQPLGQLLQQVQQGQGYTPARPCKKEPQPSSPAQRSMPSSRSPHSKQQQQQPAILYGTSSMPGSSSGNSGGYVSGSNPGPGVGGVPGDGILAKSGTLLSETVGYWLDMAASAQLPGSMSLVDIIDKVVSNVAPQQKLEP